MLTSRGNDFHFQNLSPAIYMSALKSLPHATIMKNSGNFSSLGIFVYIYNYFKTNYEFIYIVAKWRKRKSPFIFTGSSMEFRVLQIAEKLVQYLTFSYACYHLIKFCFRSMHDVIFFQINITIIMSFEYDLFYYNTLNNYSSSHTQFSTAYFLLCYRTLFF